jgi:HD-GYP domain-containing protein (c-di-GMP phosphodiesterase class II)
MLSTKTPMLGPRRQHSLADHAGALALVLQEEFGVLFTFHDAHSGDEVPAVKYPCFEGPGRGVRPQLTPPTSAALREIAAAGRAQVTPLPGGRYQMAMLLHAHLHPTLLACAEMDGCAKTSEEMRREQVTLQKWLQSVSDRLRLADQLAALRRPENIAAPPTPQSTVPWEALLSVDQVLRRGRIHKDKGKNHHRVLDAALPFLGAETLVWVPRDPHADVVIQGEASLAADDFRQLATLLSQSDDMRQMSPCLYDQFQDKPGASRFPQVINLLAFPVQDQGLIGWVIAINKRAEPAKSYQGVARDPLPAPVPVPFRKSDAALLAPFVAMIESCERAANRYQDLKELLVGLTRALTTAIDAKDSYTYGHSERVGRIAVELGRELGMEGDDLGDIYLAGLLHDVGKIGIRDAVLQKPSKLSPEEEAHIRQHVLIGYSILADLRQIRNLLPGVRYHHERYDGGGYPEGLTGESIPLLARILAVADAYDAMTTARPYRHPLPIQKVEQILAEGAGTQWDKRVVEAFMRCRLKIHSIRQRGLGESLRVAIEGALRTEADSVEMQLAALQK